jgi:hypothetical protein
MREVLISKDGGIPILLCISNVVRHRICRRLLDKHAACAALGEGTDTDPAEACQQIVRTGSALIIYLCTAMRSLYPPLCLSATDAAEGVLLTDDQQSG